MSNRGRRAITTSVSESYNERFATIVADPPWPYNNVQGPRAAPSHRPNSWDRPTGAVGSALRYGAMSIEEICSMPIIQFAQSNSHLYLWTTNSFMVEAHSVARAWGFQPKTIITWVKKKPDGTASMKAGFYYRGATEHCLFCVRGKLRLIGPPHATIFETPRLAHSVKPEYFYKLVEIQSPKPYLELFARNMRTGWSVWGNQVVSSVPILSFVKASKV